MMKTSLKKLPFVASISALFCGLIEKNKEALMHFSKNISPIYFAGFLALFSFYILAVALPILGKNNQRWGKKILVIISLFFIFSCVFLIHYGLHLNVVELERTVFMQKMALNVKGVLISIKEGIVHGVVAIKGVVVNAYFQASSFVVFCYASLRRMISKKS